MYASFYPHVLSRGGTTLGFAESTTGTASDSDLLVMVAGGERAAFSCGAEDPVAEVDGDGIHARTE